MNFFKSKVARIDNNPPRERVSAQPSGAFRDLDPYVPTEIRILRDLQSKFSVEEILEFLSASRPDLAETLKEELHRGRNGIHSDLEKAIGQVVLKNAINGLNGVHRLNQMAADGELAIAWPVPPHIGDEVCSRMDEELQFAAEDHVPPHLEDLNIRQLDDMLPDEMEAAFKNVKGILAEGRIRAGRILTRRSVVRVLQVLRARKLTLFLQNMPHLPPHAEFAQVDVDVEVIEVR